MERLKKRQHALGIVQRPAHVGVGHHIHIIANSLADGTNQVEVALHAGRAVGGSPTQTQLHGLVAFGFVALRFGGQFTELHAVKPAGVNRNSWLVLASEQAVDGLFADLPRMSPKAMSMALIAAMPMPLRPKAIVLRYMCCQRNSKSHGSAPIASGFK